MDTLQTILFVAPVLLFSVIAHEYAHGYAALKQGDNTAQQLGRLTWNPVKHIDPFLTILMPLMMGFMSNWTVVLGGAKPVPVNPRNYKHYKRGDIIVSLAGVFVNFIIALVCTVLIAVFGVVSNMIPATSQANVSMSAARDADCAAKNSGSGTSVKGSRGSASSRAAIAAVSAVDKRARTTLTPVRRYVACAIGRSIQISDSTPLPAAAK